MATTLYLIRHGETDYNASGRMQGWLDIPLNEMGFHQAKLLAHRFRGKSIAAVYASPLMRAAETARAVAEAVGAPISMDERLREYNMGDWSGLTIEDIVKSEPNFSAHGPIEIPVPNGESAQDMHARVDSFLQEVIERYPNDRVVAVSHGGTLAMGVATMLGMPVLRRQPFSFGNTSIAEADYSHGQWRLRTLNDQCHFHMQTKDAPEAAPPETPAEAQEAVEAAEEATGEAVPNAEAN